MWHSEKRLIPYYFLVGTGVDYKNSILRGKDYKGTLTSNIYASHYNARNQETNVNSGSGGSGNNNNHTVRSSEHYKGFIVEGHLGYEFEKELGDKGLISILGKINADIEKSYTNKIIERYQNDGSANSEDDDDDDNDNNKDRFDIKLIPSIKLGYKSNDNFNIEVEYAASILFNKAGYIAMGILALSSLTSFSTTIYLKNNLEGSLEHSKDNKYEYKIHDSLNLGILTGKNNEVFAYLGGKLEKGKPVDGRINKRWIKVKRLMGQEI
ncbi:hypothetical protein [Streptobacillus moniliformis]|uniref:hypothetical protein n=3 Tax=Streptobacillus moniliformis TaxID=34105 RepID=UPI0007E42CDE|nr:hypothetical protein [Streptobacillus moniliformis]